MKVKKIIVSAAAAALLGSSLYAGGDIIPPVVEVTPIAAQPLETVYYVGAGVSMIGVSKDCSCKGSTKRLKDMSYGVILKAGVNITDYIGIEARYLASFTEEDFSEVTHYGLYIKPQYKVTPEVNLYALLGYGTTTIDFTDRGKSSLDVDGLSYGAGVEFALENNMGVWIDALRLASSEGSHDTDVTVGTAGVSYNF